MSFFDEPWWHDQYSRHTISLQNNNQSFFRSLLKKMRRVEWREISYGDTWKGSYILRQWWRTPLSCFFLSWIHTTSNRFKKELKRLLTVLWYIVSFSNDWLRASVYLVYHFIWYKNHWSSLVRSMLFACLPACERRKKRYVRNIGFWCEDTRDCREREKG